MIDHKVGTRNAKSRRVTSKDTGIEWKNSTDPLHDLSDPSRKAEKSASTGLEHRLDRSKQDHQIQPGAEVPQVVKVVGELEV